MPLLGQESSFIMTLINLAGSGLYPLSLSLLLPVFMYAIVLEKEEKLLEMMKMNGLRMRYYWGVNFLFDFLLYFVTAFIFLIFGGLIMKINFFTSTSLGLLVLFYDLYI